MTAFISLPWRLRILSRTLEALPFDLPEVVFNPIQYTGWGPIVYAYFCDRTQSEEPADRLCYLIGPHSKVLKGLGYRKSRRYNIRLRGCVRFCVPLRQA